MEIKIDSQKIEEALTRAVENIYPSKKSLEEVLMSGKKLRIYHGIDPTGDLHIGHAIALKKLRQFQDLGHEIVVLIGDFTATIGDPTDKYATRKPLTGKQVLNNAKNYKKQIGKILGIEQANVKFLYNEEWTNKLNAKDILELVSNFTVARLLERDMFQERIKRGRDIRVHEFLYPIFQAYDSVSMDVDLEIGGNDQTFNMLAGRDLLKKMKNKEKFVLTLKLLVDGNGKKMGKTEGNMINLDEKPQTIYGKVMTWSDSMIPSGFELLTNVPMDQINKLSNKIKKGGINSRDLKAKLAKEIVTLCYDKKVADIAETEFNEIFRDKGLPSQIPEIKIREKEINILDLLIKTKLFLSKSEAKRMVIQGGVKIDGQPEKDWRKNIQIKKGQIIQAGKRKFAKIG
ncbi:MAG: tyrosine--tRNA ligase [Patescibacteria group bacterium]|nr:tyrosine--tRNA ligase [Patescibacteria group bacterium]MBU1876808.1 tyrosine--tRNA ligase [Patescibacteria group bacterium]